MLNLTNSTFHKQTVSIDKTMDSTTSLNIYLMNNAIHLKFLTCSTIHSFTIRYCCIPVLKVLFNTDT